MNLFIMGIITLSILVLMLAQQQAKASTQQEEIDKMTQSLEHTGQDLHSFLVQTKTCLSLYSPYADSKNSTRAAMDPEVRDCLKKNMGWDDNEIDLRFAIKPMPTR